VPAWKTCRCRPRQQRADDIALRGGPDNPLRSTQQRGARLHSLDLVELAIDGGPSARPSVFSRIMIAVSGSPIRTVDSSTLARHQATMIRHRESR